MGRQRCWCDRWCLGRWWNNILPESWTVESVGFLTLMRRTYFVGAKEEVMPKAKPKTKAGKKAKVEKVLHEFKTGALKSGSGQKVTSRDQAVAIALSESGQARKPAKAKRKHATKSR